MDLVRLVRRIVVYPFFFCNARYIPRHLPTKSGMIELIDIQEGVWTHMHSTPYTCSVDV